MLYYQKLIFSVVSSSSARMIIGASSTIYMVYHGATLYDVGLMKSIQAILILALGFFVGILSDRINKKSIHLASIFFSTLWLLLLYIGGETDKVPYFYLAEIMNAVALTLAQNNTNSYLVESYKKEKPNGNLSEAFGKLGKLEFIAMSITALLGGVLYSTLAVDLFLYTAVCMFLILLLSMVNVPDLVIAKNKTKRIIKKSEFFLVFRKFKKFKIHIACYILYGAYFQLIIQYWQILSNQFQFVSDNHYMLGIILFLMFCVQSLSGFFIEKEINLNIKGISVAFLLSQGLILLSYQYDILFLFILGIVFSMFFIRYILIHVDAEIHQDLKAAFRAKYDMLLNSILRIFSAILLFCFGYLSNSYDIKIIVFFGLVFPLFIVITDVAKKNL